MKKVTRTARILLLPDEMQKKLLAETAERYQKACIYAGKYICGHQELRRFYLHEALYPVLRDREGFCLPSQMAESVIKSASEKTRAMIQIHRKWIEPKFQRPVCMLVPGRDYTLRDECFSIRTLKERIQVPYQKKGMETYFHGKWKFGTARLLEDMGKWHLHIAAVKEGEEQELPQMETVSCVVGCDFGINFLVTAYDSQGKTKFFSGRVTKQHRATYEKNRKDLQKKNTPSARKRMRALALKEHAYLQNINHETAKKLVESYPPGTIFVVERGNHGKHLTESVVNTNRLKDGTKEAVEVSLKWSFWDLRQKIAYKATERGGFLIEADPMYSSQKCPKCGRIRKENRNKRTHTYHCDSCGYTSNDDRIGAMNLYEKGLEALRTVGMEHAPCQGAQPVVPGCNVEIPTDKEQSMTEKNVFCHTVITSKEEGAGPNKRMSKGEECRYREDIR